MGGFRPSVHPVIHEAHFIPTSGPKAFVVRDQSERLALFLVVRPYGDGYRLVLADQTVLACSVEIDFCVDLRVSLNNNSFNGFFCRRNQVLKRFVSDRLGDGIYIASALGVWGMALLTVTLFGASALLGKKLGSIFRV